MNLKMLLFASVSLVLFASCHNSDEPYMTLATKTLDVEAEGGLFTVDLSSNVYYRVNNDCQTDGSDSHWAVVDSHETQGEITKFTIKVSENSYLRHLKYLHSPNNSALFLVSPVPMNPLELPASFQLKSATCIACSICNSLRFPKLSSLS